jgi:hypothetical protein
MRIKEKLLILFVSILVSFSGFNLIASSYAGPLNGANEASCETIKSYLAKGEVNSHKSPNHDERALQLAPFNPDCSNSK